MTVAILSTGDEIINGDILNTTTAQIAHHLFSHNVPVGNHMTASDDHNDMLRAFHYLLSNHQALVVTGGLGPTSDDRTRYAMAEYFDEPLVMHEECWHHIVERHKGLGIETHEANKRQALFPKTATLFPNPHGTAYGCTFSKKGKTVFLLPGPPNECYPMFHEYALPKLLTYRSHVSSLYRWLLFGVPESQIAASVDERLKDIDCDISYRWFYPYIEIKVKVSDKTFEKSFFDDKLKDIFAPLTISPFDKTALEVLSEDIQTLSTPITLEDKVTKGHLESLLLKPGLDRIAFDTPSEGPTILLEGLSRYWVGEKGIDNETVTMTFNYQGETVQKSFDVLLKKSNPIKYAIELMAFHISQWIKEKQL